MQLIRTLKQLEYIHFLIHAKATGRPREFAEKLNVSERHLYRMLEEFKEIGFPIRYSKERESYIYDGFASISFELFVDGRRIFRIKRS